MLLIVYARIIDNKKKGLTLEGPFYGPECANMTIAHETCKKLVTPSKDQILIKICDLSEIDYYEAKKEAGIQFDRTFEQMEYSRIMCDAPKRKKFKR